MSTQKSNDFQFLDVGRVDPAKKDLDQRRDEFTEIYHPFSTKDAGSQAHRCLSWESLLFLEMSGAQPYPQLA